MHINGTNLNFILITLRSMEIVDWVSPNSYDCLNWVIRNYLYEEVIALVTDSWLHIGLSMPQSNPVYSSSLSLPTRDHTFSTIMIFSDISNWKGSDIQGKVILLTQTLQNIDILWNKFKIVDLIVLLQKNNDIEIYSWFPYHVDDCGKELKLKLLDVWQKGGFRLKAELFPSKIPQNFLGCPLVIGWTDCSPFIQNAENYYGFSGPEVQVVEDLAQAYNFSIDIHPVASRDWFYALVLPNGSYGGAISLMLSRQVDLVGASLSSLHRGVHLVDRLPSHITEYISWIAPPSIPLSHGQGYFSGLSINIWVATTITTVLSALLVIITASSSIGVSFLWAVSRLLGVSFSLPGNISILAIYSVIFEMGTLVVTTLYKAAILINLTLIPMSSYSSPEQAIDTGLFLFYRPNYQHLLSHSDFTLWDKIQTSGRFWSGLYFDYEKIVEDRTHIALVFKYIDKERILKKYPGVPYRHLVQEFSDEFLRMDQSLMLPPRHPLTEILSQKMRIIVESGLPSLYLRQYFFKYMAEQLDNNHEKGSLEISHILPACYLLTFLLVLSFLVFICEFCHFQFRKLKQ